MTWVDTLTTYAVILFLILLAWSWLQQQKMKDTITEIFEIVRELSKRK